MTNGGVVLRYPLLNEDYGMSLEAQEEEERALADAAACAERRSYAISMAAAVKSLTSADPATALEIADMKAAEADSRAAIMALEAYRNRH
jgi:hypothetical protein